MSEQNDNNKRKTKLMLFTVIAIIAVLFAGIVYQFIVIKKLEKQIEENSASYSILVENNNNFNLNNFLN